MLEAPLTENIIGALIEVHRFWGPGLYEEIYERSLVEELRQRGLAVANQLAIPLLYKGAQVGDDLRVDVIVEGKVVVEVKAVRELLPVHQSQLLTYLRLTGCRVGLLANFHVSAMKDGIRRMVL